MVLVISLMFMLCLTKINSHCRNAPRLPIQTNNHTTSEPHTHVMSNENKFPLKKYGMLQIGCSSETFRETRGKQRTRSRRSILEIAAYGSRLYMAIAGVPCIKRHDARSECGEHWYSQPAHCRTRRTENEHVKKRILDLTIHSRGRGAGGHAAAPSRQ